MAMDDILLDVEEKMEAAIGYLKNEFRGIRTGRASVGLVDHLKVDYYGSPTDLRQLATISTPEATLILIKPFDPASLKEIERAIQASSLGITPNSDGKVIRLSVPSLSTERRHQITTQLKKMAEAERIVIRNARRDGNKHIDKEQKASELTEDQSHTGKEKIQKLTKQYEKKVSEILDAKIKEIEAI
ncbi:MAG: ribosome recycling factor [Planctomycetota bacterium]|nr:ribosome recycling factor [Planctomycetota bacterium]